MPLSTQLSLSLELAKVFPLREVLANGVEQLANLVRALKRNGSDFLVEEDLADIFGRGKIEPSLEKDFRAVVKTTSFQSLYPGSPISLDAGPGATLGRALKEPFYMSCVIQLSFLAWMHEETTLAATLVESMLIRYESKVQGATPDPDYDGILKTLQACSSQTSQYRWDDLVSHVESSFPKSSPLFRLNSNPIRYLTPDLLLGAMDYLYMAQSLPEDRLIIIESQMGLIPMVVWAHHILGLTVLVKNSPDGNVAFGRMRKPQVIINWSSKSLSSQGNLTSLNHTHWVSPPTIYLLDAGMNVLLQTKPDENKGARIEGQECHRLRGYGTTFLQRLFNRKTLVADYDPIFAEAANFAVSFAILLSRVMRRVPYMNQSYRETTEEVFVPKQCYLSTEHWRLLDSSHLLFWGIKLDQREICEYLDRLSGVSIDDMALPSGIRNYLQKLEEDEFKVMRQSFLDDMKQLASWVLSFAQVVDLESCEDLPLRVAPGWMFCTGVLNWNGLDAIDIESDVWFNLIMKMMRKDVSGGDSIVRSEGIFLTCHQGWSLFHNSVGDYDPGEVNCELLSIRRGVPTNTRTGERKYRIADAPSIDQDVMTPIVLDQGSSYLSRCVTKVYKRTEHYSSRSEEFWLSIRFDIEEVDFHRRTPAQKAGRDQRYSLYASHSQFHDALWGVIKTKPCPHRNGSCEVLPLDLGANTVTGLTWANGNGQAGEARICICLVKGDARARWLVVNGIVANSDAGALNRQVLLRCDGCCEDCSVKAASAMRGQWLVIL